MIDQRRGRLAALCILLAVGSAVLGAEDFRFRYVTGDKFRVLSTVDQDIYLNRRYLGTAEILNRISFSVVDTRGQSGVLEGTFQTSEHDKTRGSNSFIWSYEYQSKFERDQLGRYTIGDEYWMPVVRNVPVFPERNLNVGDRWVSEAEEVHDFRRAYGIPEPYRIPITVNTTYKGKEHFEGKEYDVLLVSYRLFHEGERPVQSNGRWPVRITGASDQTVYWDNKLGQPVYYKESYRFIVEVSDGSSFEYRGTADARLIEASFMDRDRIAREINEDIEKQGLRDTTARATEDGVSISMDNIRFRANTTELLPGETDKLRRIAAILERYPERDILIKGHTADTRTPDKEMELSQMRAAAIAEYLIRSAVRTRERIVVRGYGATQPVAPNNSEANMARNRRVEIVLLEN